MTDWAELEEQKARARHKKTQLVFKETIEPDPNNQDLYLYTAKHNMRVSRSDIKKPELKPREVYCSYNTLANYGFLRAMCDKNGNVLAYTRGMQICGKNLIPGATRLGTWYVFEEYNVNLLTDFKIEIWGSNLDKHPSVWNYDSDKRWYTLTEPAIVLAPSQSYIFKVSGNSIKTNITEATWQPYEYQVEKAEPNERVVCGVRAAMHYAGFLSGPKPPIQDSFYPWLVMARQK